MRDVKHAVRPVRRAPPPARHAGAAAPVLLPGDPAGRGRGAAAPGDALRAQISQRWIFKSTVLPSGGHAATTAGITALAAEVEAAAVAADRATSATWAQIGAALGLSADAARKRYRNVSAPP